MRKFPDRSKDAGNTSIGQHQFHPQPNPHDPEVDHDQLLQLEARDVSGRNNNLAHPEWGSAGETLLRTTKAHYQDGLEELYVNAHPRDVSNIVIAQKETTPNSFGASDLFTYFGQFIDHDTDITPEGEEVVTVTITDDIIDSIDFHRSQHVEGTGADGGVPREHPNLLTAFLDSSNVYGSRPEVTAALRSDGGTGPYLLTSKGDFLPTLGQLGDSAPDGIVAGGDSPDLFVAGDVRVNENLALSAMHTIWAREHNNQVDRLKAKHPDWTDDQLFETAQIIVNAEFQHVVFNEYLPLLVGESNIPPYDGYDAGVNPGIATEFSTAAYRLGHSQLSPLLHRINEDGTEADAGHIRLFEAFFNPEELRNGGVDPLIGGLAAFKGQEIDAFMIDDVRNFLFGPPGAGLDLAVLNIMRGRDHGMPPLNEAREALGLGRYDDFSDLTSDPVLAARLSEAYDGQIDKIDLWVGGLSEDTVAGSQLGETFQHIVLDQFIRLRDGDRFYYEHRLKDMPDLLEEIKATSFSDIVQRNTDIEYLQDAVFLAHERIGGANQGDNLTGTDGDDLIMGFQGSDNLEGMDGDDDLYGGPGRDTLRGGPGNDLINGEQGNDEIWTGSGADAIVLERGSGQDTVHDYDVDEDILDLTGYGYESLSEVMEASLQTGGSTTIFLDQDTNDSVQLIGVEFDLA